MAELDLSKAVEEAADRLVDEGHGGFCSDGTSTDSETSAKAAITAALPHILDALADEADMEGRRGRGPNAGMRATEAARYLRAKAEEVRRG